MRKGGRTSDARLRSFEKGMLYCKLTAASGILKGLLHVSLGAVGKCCRGWVYKKAFHFCTALHELKNPPFSQTKSYPFAQAFPYCPFRKNLFHHKRFPFAPSHNLLFAKNTAFLSMFALNSYAVTPERRTDSKPFRRRFVRKTGFGSCGRKLL